MSSKKEIISAQDELTDIRLRHVADSKDKNTKSCQEHDLAVTQNSFSDLEVVLDIGNSVRMVKLDKNNPAILLKILNVWQRRLILSSANKRKSFAIPVSLSQQISRKEADSENKLLMMRRKLVNEGIRSVDIRVRDGSVLVKKKMQSPKQTKKLQPRTE